MAEQFFTKFSAVVAPPTPEPVVPPTQYGDVVAPGESPYHALAESHDHDPSNPRVLGLPVGVIIPVVVATIAVALIIYKFVFQH